MANTGGVYTWSKTATQNATADLTVNYAEGQAPSTLNDAGRAAMASVAKWRDDISGAITTTGTSTAYVVASNQNFDTAADMNNMIVAFTPNVTSGASPTLTVDGIGPYPIQSAPNTNLLPGVLVQGTPYVAIFNQVSSAWYLQGFFGSNPYNIPIGASLEYWGSTAPNSSFVFPFGQAISRTTYATLFGLFGTTYGAGDGSTTFNLPDRRGRLAVPADNMGGTQAGRINAVLGNGLGSAGGEAQHLLTTTEMPSHYHSAAIVDPGHTHGVTGGTYGMSGISYNFYTGGGQGGPASLISISSATTGIYVNSSNGANTTYSAGGGGVHNNVQPSIVCNSILRVI